MALDFFVLENNTYLFSLEAKKHIHIQDIFKIFQQWTGIFIDEYGDTQLSILNQKTLIKIIDNYVDETNLNIDKNKTLAILEFRGLLSFFISKNYNLKLAGD